MSTTPSDLANISNLIEKLKENQTTLSGYKQDPVLISLETGVFATDQIRENIGAIQEDIDFLEKLKKYCETSPDDASRKIELCTAKMEAIRVDIEKFGGKKSEETGEIQAWKMKFDDNKAAYETERKRLFGKKIPSAEFLNMVKEFPGYTSKKSSKIIDPKIQASIDTEIKFAANLDEEVESLKTEMRKLNSKAVMPDSPFYITLKERAESFRKNEIGEFDEDYARSYEADKKAMVTLRDDLKKKIEVEKKKTEAAKPLVISNQPAPQEPKAAVSPAPEAPAVPKPSNDKPAVTVAVQPEPVPASKSGATPATSETGTPASPQSSTPSTIARASSVAPPAPLGGATPPQPLVITAKASPDLGTQLGALQNAAGLGATDASALPKSPNESPAGQRQAQAAVPSMMGAGYHVLQHRIETPLVGEVTVNDAKFKESTQAFCEKLETQKFSSSQEATLFEGVKIKEKTDKSVSIEIPNGPDKNTLSRSYEGTKSTVKLSIPPPPGDASFFIMVASNRDLGAMSVKTASGPENLIKLYEAAKLGGLDLKFEGPALDQVKDDPRFKTLQNMTEEHINEFRKHIAKTPDRKLGDAIPEELQNKVEADVKAKEEQHIILTTTSKP